MNLLYFADDRGRILTEMSCIRLGEDDFMLITAAPAQWHDLAVLQSFMPDTVTIEDATSTRDTLIVTGPKSREILSGLTDADLTSGWLTHQSATVAGQPAYLLRVSFAGELGWEVHSLVEHTPAIYDALLDAGATPFGMYALNALRIEKGYRTWKGDLSSDYSMLQGALDRFVKFDKPQDFPGKAALRNEQQQGVTKRFVTLVVDAGAADAPYMSTLWHDGEVVGETTSGDWGYRVGASIALGVLRTDLAVPGTEVEVEIYGEKRKAVVQPDQPLWDPQNERLRA